MTALALALVVGAAAGAGPLERAELAFGRGDFEAAVREADQGVAARAEDAPRLFLLKARAFAALRKPEQAEAAFIAALTADPSVQLDPEKVQPSLVNQLETLRRTLRGELSVMGDAASGLTVDGVESGGVPQLLSLPIGPHLVGLGAQKPVRVMIRPNERASITLAAEPAAPTPVRAAPPPTVEAAPPSPSWWLGAQLVGLADVFADLREAGAERRVLFAMTAGATVVFRYAAASLHLFQGSRTGIGLTLGPRLPLGDRFALQAFGDAVVLPASPGPWLPAFGGGARLEVRVIEGLRVLADARLLVLLGPEALNRRNFFLGLGAEYLFAL